VWERSTGADRQETKRKKEETAMSLEEIRAEIDALDTQMKPLFLKRMECAKHVAETKAVTGGDVFVLERELAIIEKRASDVEEVYDEYVAFLRHLMSVSRRYQYGILTVMQDAVLEAALSAAGLSGEEDHRQVEIGFSCKKDASDLNLYLNMAKLNGIAIDRMELHTVDGVQKVSMVLDGTVKDSNMRRLLCQLGKESENFEIRSLKK